MEKPVKVMMVDDNKEFCEILKDYFERQDDCVVSGIANHGLQALEMLSQEMPDVMIIDLIMPHLDGIGVLEQLNAEYEERPKVIILTAFGQETQIRRAVELGAQYYILKPFDLEVLGNRVRQLANGEHGRPGPELAPEVAQSRCGCDQPDSPDGSACPRARLPVPAGCDHQCDQGDEPDGRRHQGTLPDDR